MYTVAHNSPQQPIRYRSSLTVLGTVQTILGLLSLIADSIGFFIGDHTASVYGSGIYTGIFFTLAGILSLIGSCGNDAHCLNASLVVNIIGICSSIPGLNFAFREASYFSMAWRQKQTADVYYQKVKNFFVIIVIVCQLALAIIRTALICSSQGRCCRSSEVNAHTSGQTDHHQRYPPSHGPPTYVVHYIAGDASSPGVHFPHSHYSSGYVNSTLPRHVPPPLPDLPPSYEDATTGMF